MMLNGRPELISTIGANVNPCRNLWNAVPERQRSGEPITPLKTKRCRWSNSESARSARKFGCPAASAVSADRTNRRSSATMCRSPELNVVRKAFLQLEVQRVVRRIAVRQLSVDVRVRIDRARRAKAAGKQRSNAALLRPPVRAWTKK